MSAFDDNPSNFIVYEDTADMFPCLGSNNANGPFGTPVEFNVLQGVDFESEDCVTINTMSITFMKEYRNKSFEELRLEDYLSDRKGIQRFKEEGCLKCFSDTPRSITSSCSLTCLDEQVESNTQSSAKDYSDAAEDSEVKTVKDKSFLTSSESFITIEGSVHSVHSQCNEEPARSFTSDSNDDSKSKSIFRYRIRTFFEKCPDGYAPLPCDFFVENPNNIHFMPCYDVKLAYGQVDTRSRIDWLYDECFSEQPSRVFGSIEPIFIEGGLHKQLFDVYRSKIAEEKLHKRLLEKYELTTLRKKYFEKLLCPYDPLARNVNISGCYKKRSKGHRTWTAKTHILGRHYAE
ncbi:unnamed protein product [Acanthoscelides obtectus]|uniref:Nuclear pore complex protein Nup98-Nup96 n=1 Tax=Acanthoscelides obtectus TaxID=200917 RepID=A0A9P0PXW4_ACAOB|nr:unnamed protein product [Acanthoscelides obtectus]CAK1639310.1 Nuclear pore complex protein Nup98-Nup96 [Acanthoscelides obtectus]